MVGEDEEQSLSAGVAVSKYVKVESVEVSERVISNF
jgi:hypothetical protein